MTHAEAVGCMTANLALPGAGSLAAGKAVGYAQLALSTVGFVISGVSCAIAIRWFLLSGSAAAGGDPTIFLIELWRHLRWPMAGVGIFLIALLWAVVTGYQIMSDHPKNPVPPRIDNS